MQAKALYQLLPGVKEKKAKRLYHRMVTGLQIAKNQDQPMRFMTFTTSNNRVPDKNGNIRTPQKSFEILRKRIERATIKRDKFRGFKLNKYYCLRTSEGNGVLHIVFWGGRYIPIKWLKENWEEIHGAYEVYIQFIHKTRQKVGGIVGYLLDRYLLNQPIKRMSYGWGWAWLGFCKSWSNVKYKYNLVPKSSTCILRGLPSWHHYFSNRYKYTHYQYLDRWWHKEYSYQAVPFWKGVLWQHPITSRQTKFFYPNRGWSKKYFEGADQIISQFRPKKQISVKNEVSSLRVGDFESISDYAAALLKNRGGVIW